MKPIRLLKLESDPAATERIACWHVDEWGGPDPDRGKAVALVAAGLRAGFGADELPSTWMAESGGVVVGAAQLKRREVPALRDFECWLGGVYVDPAARGRGVARQLIGRCIEEASSRSIARLYLQTEERNVALYARLGWEPAGLPPGFVHERPVMTIVPTRRRTPCATPDA